MAENKADDRRIAVNKIYIKDFSLESPRAPDVFTSGEWSPKTNLNLRSTHAPGPNDLHEVVLTITVEAKHEDKTLFLIELHQAGMFNILGYEGEELEAVVGSFCPSTLFPYARETIASMVQKAGFPEFVLQPINFDALFLESRKQAAAGKAAAGKEGEPSIN